MKSNSLLKQARLQKGWTRPQVVAAVSSQFSLASLERWEAGRMQGMREGNRTILCQLFDKSPVELGLEGNSGIMRFPGIVTIEEISMSESIRREVSDNLGSRLVSIVEAWHRRDYRYEELQGEISRTIAVNSNDTHYHRGQALKDMALIPIQLCGGEGLKIPPKKIDTHTLLKHLAAGLAVLWHLRRGKDLSFVNDLVPIYMAILQPLLASQSTSYQQAAVTLLSQSFRLKGSILGGLVHSKQAIPYYQEALCYTKAGLPPTEQVIANRMIALCYQQTGRYRAALPFAETAYRLAMSESGMPKNMQSFAASSLALVQAANGNRDDAMHTMRQARDLFDPTQPIPSMCYTESNLLAIVARVYQHGGNWVESLRCWEQSLETADISVLGMIQGRLQFAEAEVSRDDRPRNLDLCVALCRDGIARAKDVGSARYQQEAEALYRQICLVWPTESMVKQLGHEHFSMNTHAG